MPLYHRPPDGRVFHATGRIEEIRLPSDFAPLPSGLEALRAGSGLSVKNRIHKEARRAIYGIMLAALTLTVLAISGEQWLVAANSLVLLAIAIIQLQLVNLRIHAQNRD